MSSRRSADALARTFAALLLAGIGTSVTGGAASAASAPRPVGAELEAAPDVVSQPGQEAGGFDAVWGEGGAAHAWTPTAITWRSDLVGRAVEFAVSVYATPPIGSVLDLAPKTSPPNDCA